ncbi:MAG: hypothetical protein JNK16_11095 [Phycisphaerales bacterium]|mgnify:CR=1 FL=1|nr:hypothetical protein [Phycisphaerales bacterium]
MVAQSPTAAQSGIREDLGDFTTPQLVDQIIQINPTATSTYLQQFGRVELREYLEHLLFAQRPRGRDAIWARPVENHSILFAETLD